MRQITPETKLLNLVSFMGFLWCLVEILPALALGNSVACSCDTELCYHDSIVCSISEQSTFVQQSLFWLLTCYMHDAFLSITKQAPRTEREKMYPVCIYRIALLIDLKAQKIKKPKAFNCVSI